MQTRTALRDSVTGAYSVDATVLAEGTYTAKASQSDAAGNTGHSSANTFVVDTGPGGDAGHSGGRVGHE